MFYTLQIKITVACETEQQMRQVAVPKNQTKQNKRLQFKKKIDVV